jgi:hypothetical protein
LNPPAQNFSALTTDLYEVTMACVYWEARVSEHEAAFRGFHFDENGIAYLALQAGMSLFALDVCCSNPRLVDGRRIDRTRPLL